MTPVDEQVRAALRALAWNAKAWRNHRGAGIERLAEMAELSPRVIQRVEAGEVDPRLKTIASLAAGLQVDIRDLFIPIRGASRF